MCFSACTVTNGGDAFSITTVTADPTFSAVGPTDAAGTLAVCLNDFLLIVDGTDPTTGLVGDRFCGNELNPNPAGLATSVPVCSKFSVRFHFFVSIMNSTSFIVNSKANI